MSDVIGESMFLALDSQTQSVVCAPQLTQIRDTYTCRVCNTAVEYLFDNRSGLGYFAHRKAVRCPLHKKSDYYHRACKWAIYQTLCQFRVRVQLEYVMRNPLCADLFIDLNGQLMAVEIERPSLSAQEVERVTQAYTEKSIPVLWVMLNGRCDNHGVYRPKEYERTLSAMRQGLLLFWRGGMGLTVGYLAPHCYYPSKVSYAEHKPKVYKRTNRLLFSTDPVSLTSLIPKWVHYQNKTFLFAVEPNLIRWPVLEKPVTF